MSDHNLRNRQVSVEAADWAVRLDAKNLNADDRRRLAAWLLESPLHGQELLLSASLLCGIADISSDYPITVENLLDETAPEVVPLIQPFQQKEQQPPARQEQAQTAVNRFHRVAAGIAFVVLSVCVITVGGGYLPFGQPDTVAYSTELGEQRSITLPDNSILHMNTQSNILVRYSKNQRVIELESGEALFDVEKDPSRPFKVVVNDTVVEAIGTKFNIDRSKAGASILVLEGRVAVGSLESIASSETDELITATVMNRNPSIPSSINDGRFFLTDNQQADIQQDGRYSVSNDIDADEVLSWRLRRLTFNSQPLSEIADEFNRYNRIRISIEDQDLSAVKLSGIFEADDPMSLIQFLELNENIIVDQSNPNFLVLSRSTQ